MGMQLNKEVKLAESRREGFEMEVLTPQQRGIGLMSALSEVEGGKEGEEEDGERSVNRNDDDDDDDDKSDFSSSGSSSSSVFVVGEKMSKNKFQTRSHVTSHSSYGSEDASIDEAHSSPWPLQHTSKNECGRPYHTNSQRHDEEEASLNSRHGDGDGGFGGLPYHLNSQRKESEGYQSMLPTPTTITQDVTFQFPSHHGNNSRSLSRSSCNYKVYENIITPDLEKVEFSYPKEELADSVP